MIPEGDEKAVMEAVYSRGPLAISLDASHDSFRFYASGMLLCPALDRLRVCRYH